jgi:aspartate racemase
MKRIGVLGGMSWESTAVYYRLLNETVRERLGGLHSADLVLRSVDFAAIETLQIEDRWDDAADLLADDARALAAAGAELIVLATNTMHKVADAITRAVDLPFIHIADTTAEAVARDGHETVGLLATRYTMEQDFYVGRLKEAHGLQVLIPDEPDRTLVHDVIFDELCVGVVSESSRAAYRRVIEDLVRRGATAVVLGCTEVGLLVQDGDATVPFYDSAALHVRAAVDAALR